jgi:hypothetical protein
VHVNTLKHSGSILPSCHVENNAYFLRYISTLYTQEKWPEEETVCDELAAHLRKRFNTNVLRHFRPEFGPKMKRKHKTGQPVAFTDVFGMAIGDALLQASLYSSTNIGSAPLLDWLYVIKIC